MNEFNGGQIPEMSEQVINLCLGPIVQNCRIVQICFDVFILSSNTKLDHRATLSNSAFINVNFDKKSLPIVTSFYFQH